MTLTWNLVLGYISPSSLIFLGIEVIANLILDWALVWDFWWFMISRPSYMVLFRWRWIHTGPSYIVISFPFRALSSWPKVIFFLIYDLESFLFHLEAWAHDPKSFFLFMTYSHFFHLEPGAHDPKSFLSFRAQSCFSHLCPRVISFLFRALSSWPKVIFLIYDPESCFSI